MFYFIRILSACLSVHLVLSFYYYNFLFFRLRKSEESEQDVEGL